jgi:hypothetical protein
MRTHKPVAAILLVLAIITTTAVSAGTFISDGHGGSCTDDGTSTPERPKCTKAQHDAAYGLPKGNAADQYIARKDQALRSRANWFLHQDGMKALQCEHVVAVVGGDLNEPFIAAIVCDNSGRRVLYEVLNHAYSLDKKGHARVATSAEIDTDLDTLNKGLGLAGTWWSK